MLEERFRKNIIESGARQYQERTEAKSPGLIEIIRNPKLSSLLVKILETENNETLATKILNKEELDQQDLDTLIGYRTRIGEALNLTKEVLKNLSNETILFLGANDPQFQKILDSLGGAKQTRDYLEAYLPFLAVTDQSKYNELSQKLKTINEARERMGEIDTKLSELSKRYGISDEVLNSILSMSSQTDRENALAREVRKRIGAFRRVMDMVRGGKYVGEIVGEFQMEEILKKEGEITNALKEIGGIIGSEVLTSPEGMKILSQVLMGSSPEEASGRRESIANIRSEFTEEGLQKSWNQFLNERGIEWDKLGDQQAKDMVKTEYRNSLEARYSKFLWKVINSIFNNNLESFLRNL